MLKLAYFVTYTIVLNKILNKILKNHICFQKYTQYLSNNVLNWCKTFCKSENYVVTFIQKIEEVWKLRDRNKIEKIEKKYIENNKTFVF